MYTDGTFGPTDTQSKDVSLLGKIFNRLEITFPQGLPSDRKNKNKNKTKKPAAVIKWS